MRALGVIPAKEYSERVVGKNTALLGGKPLFLWTVDAAIECKALEQIIVSTDSTAVADLVRGRPVVTDVCAQVHTGDARAVVAHHARYNQRWGFDTVVMLLPTSPFRTSEDIWNALELHRLTHSVVISVTSMPDPRTIRVMEDGRLKVPHETVVRSNGAIQIDSMANVLTDPFNHTGAEPYYLTLPGGLDIDTPEDWELARRYVNEAA